MWRLRVRQAAKDRAFRKMIRLCGGDHVLAYRLYGSNVIHVKRRPMKRDEPWDIDWSDCALAHWYGVL